MSPNVGNFVHDLVEMAKAMETLPGVQAECQRLEKQHIIDGERIAQLEMRLMDRANHVSELEARIRSLEVERDDAGFRQLEAEDRFEALRRAIGVVQATMGEAIRATEPPVPTPEPQQVPEGVSAESPPVQGQGASPLPSQTGSDGSATAVTTAPTVVPAAEAPTPFPSVPSTAPQSPPVSGDQPDGPQAQPSQPAETQADVSSKGKYSGQSYRSWPYYVSRESWIAGGGDPHSYDEAYGTPVAAHAG